jgi:hypothetical protein
MKILKFPFDFFHYIMFLRIPSMYLQYTIFYETE